MMKSFTLHLIVVFIVGAQYHQIGTLCSSTAASPAHDRSTLNRSVSAPQSQGTTHLQHHQQGTKTPRTIQRLVGGHLQYVRDRNSQHENVTESGSIRNRNHLTRRPSSVTTNVSQTKTNRTVLRKIKPKVDDWDSDSALLESDSNWDNGILRSSAGAGKEVNGKGKKKDDSKKTLFDQVKEGKYGLIEKELFQNDPKRPGIISYLGNREVPSDTAQNYGGLNEDDIWLAEDHLLVIKGGSLNDDEKDEPWEPIDDYQAPNRQIKIPANPKIPPPFPVQFEDNGPIQFIGNNKFPIFYPFANKSVSLYPGDGYLPSEANSDDEKNLLTRPGPFKNATDNNNGYFYPPPQTINNETFINPFLMYGPPPIGPNGSFDNNTDYIDEDDPSLYYPPPYSFVYKSNYTSAVPPGPLVPGIVLPPPPDAFARLEEPPRKSTPKEIPFKEVLTKISEYTPKTIVITTTTTSTTKRPTITKEYSTKPPKEIYYTITRQPKPDRTRIYSSPKHAVTNAPPPPLQQDIVNFISKVVSTPPPSSQHVNYVAQVPSQIPTIPPKHADFIHKVNYAKPKPQETITFVPELTTPTPESQEILNFIPKGPLNADTLSKGNPIYYEYFDARKNPSDATYYNTYRPALVRPTSKGHQNIQIAMIQQVQNSRFSKNYVPQRAPYNFDDYVYITPKPDIRPNGVPKSYLPLIQSNKPIQSFEQEIDAIQKTLDHYKHQQIPQNYIPRPHKGKAVYEYSFEARRANRDFTPPPQYDSEPFKPMVKYSRPIDDVNGFKAIIYTKPDGQQDNYHQTSTTPKPYGQSSGYVTTVRPVDYSTNQPVKILRIPQDQNGYNLPHTTSKPWVSIEKQVVKEINTQLPRAPPHRQRNSNGYARLENSQRTQFAGYYYEPPGNNGNRQNDRYYQLVNNKEPLARHLNAVHPDINQYQHERSLPISLENDTYVNYVSNRPPINPDAEFIRPPYLGQFDPKSQPQRLPPSRGQPISLSRDIYVNYKLPLPPINRDSEFIGAQVSNRNAPIYHRPQQYRTVPDHSGSYYFTPRETRYRKK